MKNKTILLHFDRALSNSLIKQIGLLVSILCVTLALSFLFLSFSGSEWRAFCDSKDLKPWLLPLYLLIDANALNCLYMGGNVHGWMLFASSLTYILGVFIFNGMLVGVIVNAISNRIENHRKGLTHYLNSGHYIIMGYDEMVPSIIEDIFDKDKDANVLLLTAFDVLKVKEWLKNSIAKSQWEEQIIVNYGQRTANEYYPEIHLETAAEIYIVGYRTNPAHDAINIECIDSVCSYLKNYRSDNMPKRITCVFEDLDTYAAFKTSEIFNDVRELGIEFVPYNFYSGWAKQVFLARSYKEKCDPTKAIPYPCIYGEGISPEDGKHVHLVFIGTTNFAVAFAMEAAHMLHFPNYERNENSKTRITFIEQNTEKELAQFITRNRHYFEIQSFYYRDLSDTSKDKSETCIHTYLSKEVQFHDFLDVEFEFIKGDVYSKDVQDLIRVWAKDNEHQYLSIFFSQADQRSNFMMGMNMPDEVYDNEIPVFIRQDKADNFITNLRNADKKNAIDKDIKHHRIRNGELDSRPYNGRYANLYPFGMNDMAYCGEDQAYRRAKLINFLYCTADYNCNRFKDLSELAAIGSERVWKKAEEEWRKLSVALKWSNLYCAYSIPSKLASLRAMRQLKSNDTSRDKQPLSEEEIQLLAVVEHNRWNVEKLLMGFRSPKQDEDKYLHSEFANKLKKNKDVFIHNDIRPYDELDGAKLMDYELVKYIPWILKMTHES